MNILHAIILAIVEGLTEFLPVSSTGHMIITAALLGIPPGDFTKVFIVAIQFGAILSVVVLYFKRFFKGLDFYFKLFAAFLPTAILGFLLKSTVDKLLESVTVVAFMLLVGGIILLFVDKWFAKNEQHSPDEDTISYPTALLIGIFQSLAMVPGVSRSAATIIGGLTQKLTRQTAAEFSFFLAVPTMFAATAKSLWDDRELFMAQSDNWGILVIGNIVAFIVAMAAIRFFIGFLTKYGFKAFGYYRIIVGAILLILIIMGIDLKIVD
ncbi:undecaprenyl-diphosphate phosphatase [Xanthocytophaga flava]|uniref:undecaprenyl-diphosphate phosphatase n=1 Tax=Xanthocytophaga flava TaxID=3048013 RepID=UPI0028D25EAC|nr:undecaprenyl-diphosphate phosphatase [Xanthocytophaga flavus]MDJ1470370.1 undecaprenyl-diphosphate phosphatase [Xanthocytophaga flavus]